MDAVQLSQAITPLLAAGLPYLLKAGDHAAEEAGKKFGADTWERIKTLWGLLRPKVEARSTAHEASKDVAMAPDDGDSQAALRLQLRKILDDDPHLAAEVARLWYETQHAGSQVIASGERSVAIGRDVAGSNINTGDLNNAEPDR